MVANSLAFRVAYSMVITCYPKLLPGVAQGINSWRHHRLAPVTKKMILGESQNEGGNLSHDIYGMIFAWHPMASQKSGGFSHIFPRMAGS